MQDIASLSVCMNLVLICQLEQPISIHDCMYTQLDSPITNGIMILKGHVVMSDCFVNVLLVNSACCV